MMLTRRGFLSTILAAAVAPAIVRADSLMRIVPRDATIIFPACATNKSTVLLTHVQAKMWEEVSAIDTTTMLSAAKEYFCTSILYRADVHLEVPPDLDLRKLRADGQPLDLRHCILVPGQFLNGITLVGIDSLDLTPFGNRIPSFTIEEN